MTTQPQTAELRAVPLEKSDMLCWFYGREQGCLNGSNCRFVHVTEPLELNRLWREKRAAHKAASRLKKSLALSRARREEEREALLAGYAQPEPPLSYEVPCILPCYAFQRDRCSRADQCPYPHRKTSLPLVWRKTVK